MFLQKRRILFGDCDPGGIIYTPRIGHFVVEASIGFFSERLGGSAERRLFEMGVAPPARALSVEFLKPMTWDDELEIAAEVEELRTSAIVLSFVGSVDGNKTFTAKLTVVIVSTETMKPVEIPAALRRALSGE